MVNTLKCDLLPSAFTLDGCFKEVLAMPYYLWLNKRQTKDLPSLIQLRIRFLVWSWLYKYMMNGYYSNRSKKMCRDCDFACIMELSVIECLHNHISSSVIAHIITPWSIVLPSVIMVIFMGLWKYLTDVMLCCGWCNM